MLRGGGELGSGCLGIGQRIGFGNLGLGIGIGGWIGFGNLGLGIGIGELIGEAGGENGGLLKIGIGGRDGLLSGFLNGGAGAGAGAGAGGVLKLR